jgi:hypothetical protein
MSGYRVTSWYRFPKPRNIAIRKVHPKSHFEAGTDIAYAPANTLSTKPKAIQIISTKNTFLR